MLETLLWMTDTQLAHIWLERWNIWDNEAMLGFINRMFSNETFAKAVGAVRTVTNSNVNCWWLVATWIDNSMIWFNNGTAIIHNSIIDNIIMWYMEYTTTIDDSNKFSVWNVITPVVQWDSTIVWLQVWHYKVVNIYNVWQTCSIACQDLRNGSRFLPYMVIEDALWQKYAVINSTSFFTLSDFNWNNIHTERVKAKIRPAIESMINRDKDRAIQNYEEAMKNLIRSYRELESTNNAKSIDEYTQKIIDNISTSTVELGWSEVIENVEEKPNFSYDIHTKELTCDGKNIWPYKLSIDLYSWSVLVYNKWIATTSINQHPHIRGGGSVCWGGLSTNIAEAMKFWNLSLVVDCCIWLITSLNPNSVYIGMEDWYERVKNTTWYRERENRERYKQVIEKFEEDYKNLQDVRLADKAKYVFYWHQVYSITF